MTGRLSRQEIDAVKSGRIPALTSISDIGSEIDALERELVAVESRAKFEKTRADEFKGELAALRRAVVREEALADHQAQGCEQLAKKLEEVNAAWERDHNDQGRRLTQAAADLAEARNDLKNATDLWRSNRDGREKAESEAARLREDYDDIRRRHDELFDIAEAQKKCVAELKESLLRSGRLQAQFRREPDRLRAALTRIEDIVHSMQQTPPGSGWDGLTSEQFRSIRQAISRVDPKSGEYGCDCSWQNSHSPDCSSHTARKALASGAETVCNCDDFRAGAHWPGCPLAPPAPAEPKCDDPHHAGGPHECNEANRCVPSGAERAVASERLRQGAGSGAAEKVSSSPDTAAVKPDACVCKFERCEHCGKPPAPAERECEGIPAKSFPGRFHCDWCPEAVPLTKKCHLVGGHHCPGCKGASK